MIYKTKQFQSLFKRSQITDKDLISACREMDKGLIDADLGGNLYKKRIAIPGKGKSSGYRTLVGAITGRKYFFLFIFAKSDRSNINKKEALALRELANEFIHFDEDTISALLENVELIEVRDNE